MVLLSIPTIGFESQRNMTIHYTQDTLPVFEFELEETLIEQAFNDCVSLRINNDSFKNQQFDLIVANKNVEGEKIVTELKFVSNTKSHLNHNIGKLANKIETLCKEISTSFYGMDVDYEVKNSTVLMYEENDSISRHHHFPYTFVAATYIHVSDNSAPILLGNTEIKPRNNTCLIFPGHLSHEVIKTKSDRIMITMDVQVII